MCKLIDISKHSKCENLDFTPFIYGTYFDFPIKCHTCISALYFAHEQWLPSFISGNVEV